MIKSTYSLFFTFVLFLSVFTVQADENKLTSINLKHIAGTDVISVLKALVDKSVLISEKNDVLLINGPPDKTKNILHIISKIDTPAVPLTIEFIASNRKVDFKNSRNTYRSAKNRSNTSQSMSIIERQWVTLNTGLSIPVAQRKRYADGTETQSFTYKKVSKQYVFKVHEFSGWSVIQVGLNTSSLSDDVAGAIEHTKLDTTIVGKTGEWLEVASSKPVSESDNSKVYSSASSRKKYIHLYVKVKEIKNKPDVIIEINPETEKTK